MKNKLYKTLQLFLLTTILFAVILCFIKLIEYLYLSDIYESIISFQIFLTGLKYEISFAILCSFISLILAAIYFFREKEILLTINRIMISLLLLFYLGLTQYFLTNKEYIGTALFTFSFKDIFSIAMAELSFNRILFWSLYLFIPLFIFIDGLFKKVKTMRAAYLIIWASVYLSTAIFLFTRNEPVISLPLRYDEEIQYHFSNNKILFLSKLSFDKITHRNEYGKLTPEELQKAIKQYQYSNNRFEFVSDEYPLLHKDNYPNVLGNYFPVRKTKPNIVIIIVEGLSSFFVGSDARVGSLMPFTDSLISKSLYWKNFYSTSSGTYAALPSILSSLPNGYYERGFINTPFNYPGHSSLIKILSANGYESAFYYSGDAYFDQTKKFLKYHGVKNIYDAKVLDPDYFKMVVYSKWSSWGLDDKLLFQKSFAIDDKEKINNPYLKIYQTLSIHSPFNIVPPEYLYDETIRKRLAKLNLKNADELKSKYKDVIGSIFLADDALKYFFEQSAKEKNFENTIFIITGDHAVKEFPFKNDLERYHVPLIIYSLMLKKAETFISPSTHVDMLPSLLALLKDNFEIATPGKVHWLGKGLNTSHNFEAVNIADLGNFSGSNLHRGIWKNYFIYENKINSINQNSGLEPVNDENLALKLMKQFDNFSLVWSYITLEDKIIPR